MVSTEPQETDRFREVRERKAANRRMLSNLITPIAHALDVDAGFLLPDDAMNEGYGDIVLSDGMVIDVHLDQHSNRLSFSGELKCDGVNLRDFVPRDRTNPRIQVNPARHPADIAKDIQRRLIPEFYDIYRLALERWRADKAKERLIASLGAEFQRTSGGGFTPRQDQRQPSYCLNYHYYHKLNEDGPTVYGEAIVYDDEVDFKLDNIPMPYAMRIAQILAEIKNSAPTKAPKLARKANKVSKPLTKRGKRK